MRRQKLLAALLAAAMVFTSLPEGVQAKPVEAVETNLAENVSETVLSEDSVGVTTSLDGDGTDFLEDNFFFGHIDSGIDVDNPTDTLDEIPVGLDIPAAYNLADENLVTDVRNQSSYGICWAFAATGSIESSLVKSGQANRDTLDFSDLATAYFGERKVCDPLGNTSGDSLNFDAKASVHDAYKSQLENSYPTYTVNLTDIPDLGYLKTGGNNYLAIAGLSHGYGLFDEAITGYPLNDKSIGSHDEALEATEVLDADQYHEQTKAELTDARIFKMSNPELAKEMLMTYGAAGVSFYVDWNAFSTTGGSNRKNYYYAGGIGSNHDVVLIGWDDNYPKTNFNGSYGEPAGNGAWIIKNSWGTNNAWDGYCYISYYDTSLSASDATCYSAEAVDNGSSSKKLYQYDGTTLPARFNMGSAYYQANVYTADGTDGDEKLQQVSFYTGADTTYEIEVYKNPTQVSGVVKNPRTGTLIAATSGKEAFQGYHTAKISSNAILQEGDRFSVVIKQESSTPMLFCEKNFAQAGWSIKAASLNNTTKTVTAEYYGDFIESFQRNAGESMVGSVQNGTFTDMTAWNGGDYGNIMIHAATKSMSSISFHEAEKSVNVGETIKQTPVILKGRNNGYTYSSSDADIAVVAADGTVTGVKAGKTTITAVASDGATAAYMVTVQVPLSLCTVSDIDAQQYTGKPIIPVVDITYGTTALVLDEDYSVKAANNVNEGTAKVTVSGLGYYTGTLEKTFTIVDGHMSVSFNGADSYVYSGTEIKPEVSVARGAKTLSANDYQLSYKNNKNAGTASVTVKAKADGLSVSKYFTISPCSINDVLCDSIPDQELVKGVAEPVPSLQYGSENLVLSKDYTLEYRNNTQARVAHDISRDPMVVVTGCKNYTGTRELHFSITGGGTEEGTIPIEKAAVTNIAAKVYNGQPQEQQPCVILKKKILTEGTDYYLEYMDAEEGDDHTNAGKVTLIIHGMGDYTGEIKKKFTIKPCAINSPLLDVSLDQYVFAKVEDEDIEPYCTVSFRDGTGIPEEDYKVIYPKNCKVGINTVTVRAVGVKNEGSGNFTGSKTVKFRVCKEDFDVELEPVEDVYSYTGAAVKPDIRSFTDSSGNVYTVGTDCKLAFQDNTRAGTAVAYMIGKGDYKGKLGYVNFTINQVDESELTYNPIKAVTFKNKALYPKPVIKNGKKKLTAGTDYNLFYYDNTSRGTGTVFVVFKGNYTGTHELTFTIN